MKTRLPLRIPFTRMIAWTVVLFAFGIFCGWWSRSLLIWNAGPDASQTLTAVATTGANLAQPAQTQSDTSSQGDFFSRVHVVLSIGNRAKRERSIRAVADDLDARQIQEA